VELTPQPVPNEGVGDGAEDDAMAEIRLEVLLEAARSGETVTEVCRRYGICRKTYYRYLRRYRESLVASLGGPRDIPRSAMVSAVAITVLMSRSP
jgi:transposase-like protein